jgi:response regulator RpfG family c-di-GMP phosphodiesterase
MLQTSLDPRSTVSGPAPAGPATHAGPRAGALGSLRRRVLVVDDDEVFAQTIADALCDRDIEAVSVVSPQEAISLARRTPFAAAVVDLVMPEMDGLELARSLRRDNPATEVVMLTGHADMHSAVEAVRNELFDYLQKMSLQPVRLRRAVRAAIARGELRAENRQLIKSLDESSRKLRVLNDISARLAAEPHLDRLLEEIVGAAKSLLEAESARVILMERNELGDMTIRAAVGDGEAVLGAQFGLGDGIATHVAEHERPLRVAVPADHPSYSPRCDDMPATLPGLACAPLSRPALSGAVMVAGRTRPFTDADLSLLASLARQGAVAVENVLTRETHENFFTHASETLVSLLDSQDVHYVGHSHNVAALVDMVTRRLDLPEAERRTVHFAALLHDIGKLRLGPALLAAGRSLTEDETLQMREHPALALDILRPISRWAGLPPIIHAHHERWDGGGYPRGLAGDAIPLGGRIVAVAEAFEAMTRSLPHRPGRSVDEALAEIEACAGSQFDPAIAQVFVEEYRHNRERLLVTE